MNRPADGFGARFALPLVLGPALNSINTTMISVALVPIADATGTSVSQVVLLVAGLYLASAVAQPVMGKLVDLYGPRKIYVTGMALAALAGLVPLFAPTFAGALVSRIVVGVGTSAAYPAAMASIRVQATRVGREPPRELFSALSVSSLTSAAVGPVLGGVLVAGFGWPAIFVVNAPYGVAAIAFALRWLPGDRDRPRVADGGAGGRGSLDVSGLVLFAVAVGTALVFALGLWPGRYWLPAVTAVAVAALVFWERRHPEPFLDVRTLTARPALVRTYARLFLVYSCMYLVIYGMTQWLQATAGYTADAAGWMQLPAVVLAGVAAALVSRGRGIRLPLLLAAAIPAAGGLLLTTLSHDSPTWVILAAIALFGPPQGLAAVSNQVALYRQAPDRQMGVSAGMSRTAVQLGAIAASSVIGPLFGRGATDADLHVVGWIITALAAAALLLTATDPALRRGRPPGDPPVPPDHDPRRSPR
ncbi:MFS transporter [Myceligenerans pegani]|uniref:MFS transporter n=1 Tax=Myceligenerans pegani TaxID=2776917 RepID=A0ABR9MXF4_9MICO|nr:MFS transporter [Myceligenerans sp. TRM 65318]MBE1876074.1 MFS transporter [Myceligenerans sp. TRM 65318]MBE3018345.1 MFS transporter [Myceligenerans sp. TRM 65318]